MTTSFYNGVSGMKSFQYGIGTWANNISNINTIGYKENIPEFGTIFSNTLNSTSTNPVVSDVGNGSVFFASAKNFSEGGLIKSDNPFDLAIVGDAFFKVDDFYTKNGQFDVDKDSYLVDDNGHYLQASMLYKGEEVIDEKLIISKENFSELDNNALLNTNLSKVKLPPNLLSPAKATENLSLQTVLSNTMQNPLLSDKNSVLGVEYVKKDDKYFLTNLEDGDEIVAGFGDFTIDQNLVYTDIPIKDVNIPLVINTAINGQNINLEFTDPSTTTEDIKKAISDALNKHNIKNAITNDGVRVCGYNKLIIQSNDTVFKNIAVERIKYSSTKESENEFHTNEELSNILNLLSQSYNSNNEVTFEKGSFVFTNNSPDEINFTFYPTSGKLKNFTSIFPTLLTNNSKKSTESLYLNEQKFSGYYYDSDGNKNNLTFSFIKEDVNKYSFTIFDENNSVLSQNELFYENNIFTPNEIKFNNMNLKLDLALQNAAFYDTIFSQDGFPKGELDHYEVDNDGTILAYFNNNKEAIIGKIPIFHFQNSQGLEAIGNNLFTETSNSGEKLVANFNYFNNPDNPITNYGYAKIAYIKSGMLENSNVNFGEAMTELIITQKAFSSAAKTVTTSDQMIQKAINMKKG